MLMLSSSRDSSSARRAVLLRIAHEQQERNGQLGPKHGQVRHALGGTAFAVLGRWERRSTALTQCTRELGRSNARLLAQES